MSDELARVCDSLLISTSILDHHYGIPDIKENQVKFASNNSTLELETKYHELYDEFCHKLNKLTYLNKLNELNKQSNDNIEQQYHEFVNNKLDKIPFIHDSQDDEIAKLKSIRQFYQLQIDTFKTNLLLNNYLQISLPILRSIHHLDIGVTTTELNMSQNLSALYSKTEADSNANINRLIKEYSLSNSNIHELDSLTETTLKLVLEELQPKLKHFNDTNIDLKSQHKKLIDVKESQIKKLLDDSNDDIHNKFANLVNQWAHLSVICDFLPGFIISLPIDWYQDKGLQKIMKDCETISQKLSKYQLIININTLKNSKLEDLFMIDLDELVPDKANDDFSED